MFENDDYMVAINDCSYVLSSECDYQPESPCYSKFPDIENQHICPQIESDLNLSRLAITNPCLSQPPTYNSSSFEREDSFADETISTARGINETLLQGILRTVAEVIRMRTVNLPVHLPSGPWISAEIAKEELSLWAHNISTGGGRFSVNWSANIVGTSKRSPKDTKLSSLKKGQTNWRRKIYNLFQMQLSVFCFH